MTTTETITVPTEFPPITLDVSVCDQRRGYRVTFEGPRAEAMALAFMAVRTGPAEDYPYGNHAFHEVEEAPVDAQYRRLLAELRPLCEHHLSAFLCYGPGHYPTDAQLGY